MHAYEHNLILQRYPSSTQRFIVLNQERGKILLTVLNQHYARQLHPGTYFSCTFNHKNTNLYLSATTLHDITSPSYHNPNDIFWYHHLLELCKAFLPEHQPHPDVFNFITNCIKMAPCSSPADPDLNDFQSLCTGVLMWLLGFYPPESCINVLLLTRSICENGLYQTNAMPYPFATLLQKSENKELEQWIVTCMQSHPQSHAFKASELLRRHHHNGQTHEED
ncbi:MAG: hypothetical protein WC365_06040 [Candidatus Babeliales bacterium]|jgi:hypothetical protein